jgi:hypothetical protein
VTQQNLQIGPVIRAHDVDQQIGVTVNQGNHRPHPAPVVADGRRGQTGTGLSARRGDRGGGHPDPQWIDTLAVGDWSATGVGQSVIASIDCVETLRTRVPYGGATTKRFLRLRAERP